MASITFRNETVNLVVAEADNDTIANTITTIADTFRATGGIWLECAINDGPMGVHWFPAQGVSVRADFDGEVPEKARRVATQLKK